MKLIVIVLALIHSGLQAATLTLSGETNDGSLPTYEIRQCPPDCTGSRAKYVSLQYQRRVGTGITNVHGFIDFEGPTPQMGAYANVLAVPVGNIIAGMGATFHDDLRAIVGPTNGFLEYTFQLTGLLVADSGDHTARYVAMINQQRFVEEIGTCCGPIAPADLSVTVRSPFVLNGPVVPLDLFIYALGFCSADTANCVANLGSTLAMTHFRVLDENLLQVTNAVIESSLGYNYMAVDSNDIPEAGTFLMSAVGLASVLLARRRLHSRS